MHLVDLERRLTKLDLEFELAPGAAELEIAAAEDRLGVSYPLQVRQFYRHANGLCVRQPMLKVYSLGELRKADDLLEFALFDGRHAVGLDTSELNEAGQWNIVNVASGFVLTLSMASFWSNKIWAWLQDSRPVWAREHDNQPLRA